MIYSNYFEFVCVIFIMIETEPSGTNDTNDLALKYRFSRIIHIHIFFVKISNAILKHFAFYLYVNLNQKWKFNNGIIRAKIYPEHQHQYFN